MSAIASVNMAQMRSRNVGEAIDGVDRRRCAVGHMMAREEAGDVQGNVRIYGREPGGKGVHFIGAIVFTGNDEGGDFDMTMCCSKGDALFDSLKIAAEGMIPILGESFEVDVCSVDERQQRLPWLRGNGAIGDEHVLQSDFVRKSGAVADVFIADKGLIVGIGDADVAAILQGAGERYELIR